MADAAAINGVMPMESAAFTSAPFAASASTTAVCPCEAAASNAVAPLLSATVRLAWNDPPIT